MYRSLKALTLAMTFMATSIPYAAADIVVRFDEGAPTDRFTIVNRGACAIGPATIIVDLGGSPYGLIFDVTGNGAGVQVFQPVKFVAGRDLLVSLPRVADGDTRIALQTSVLKPGAQIAFTTDIDDTVKSREITVSDTEISGATVVVREAARTWRGTFGTDAVATVPIGDDC